MKTIILVQPNMGFWQNYNPDPVTPLGPLRLASLIHKQYNILLIDQRIDKEWESELINALKKDVLCVGITSMTGVQIYHALKAADIIRKYSKAPIIWGGVHPTLMAEQTLLDSRVDIIVLGEGEYTFKELIEKLDKNQELEGVEGVWYKKNGLVIKNNERKFCDMNKLPFLPTDLLYNYINLGREKELYMETSRGCPFQCGYCYNQSFNGGRFRTQSAERVLEEIDYYVKKFKIKKVFFVDDEFFLDLERAKKIVFSLIERDYSLKWECQGIRIDSILKLDEDFINDLVIAGCSKLLVGVETGSLKMLKYIKKGITVQDVINANKKMKKYPIQIRYNFMCGFPNETLTDLKLTAKLMVKLIEDNPRAKIAFMSIYKPYPGTFLYEESKKQGFKEPSSLDEWGKKYNWEQPSLVYLSNERRNLLELMHLVAYGLRINRTMKKVPLILHPLAHLYKYIAKFRFKHFYFGFPFEIYLKSYFLKN